MRMDRFLRFLAIYLEVNFSPFDFEKGKEMEVIESTIKRSTVLGREKLDDLQAEYQSINIEDANNLLFSNGNRGFYFLRSFMTECADIESYKYWRECDDRIDRCIPQEVFNDHEIFILKLEWIFFSYYKNDSRFRKHLLFKAEKLFAERLTQKSDAVWVKKRAGENMDLKKEVCNNFAIKNKFSPIENLEDILKILDFIFITKGDCYKDFKKITDSYRTKKSNTRSSVAKLNLTIRSNNEKWLRKMAELYGVPRSKIIDVIIDNKDKLKIEKFLEERERMWGQVFEDSN